MFLNFGRFFGFGFQSKMDNLLKQKDLTLEQILNEEDILNELKNQSSGKFADFITGNPNEYKKMIGYIVDDFNEEEVDKNKYIKYPFLISEILGAENENLINFLFEKPAENSQEEVQNPLEDHPTEQMSYSQSDKELIRASLLQELLRVLEKDSIIVTSAGYFSKIIQAIIHKRGYDFWEFVKHNPDIITNIFKHASQRHISEILEKLIILDTSQEEQEERLFVQERQNLIYRLQKFMAGKQDSKSILSNCCEVFIEVYRRVLMSLETMTTLKDILLQSVESPSFFMKIAINTQNPTVYNLLNAQYEFYSKVLQPDDEQFLAKYHYIIDESANVLHQKDDLKVSFTTTYGKTVTPLGDTKLNFIQFFIQIIQKDQIASAFNSAAPFLQFINLLQEFPSNNQLQILFERLVTAIVETKNENLQTKFFLETNFLETLIQINDPTKRNKEFGYYGVLTKITNFLNLKQLESEIISKSIKQQQQNWDTYLDHLSVINQKEQSYLLGMNPRRDHTQVSVDTYSPPLQMPEPLVQYPYTGPGIRHADSSEVAEGEQNENQNQQEQQDQQEIEAENVATENSEHQQQPTTQVDVQELQIESPSELEQVEEAPGHQQLESPIEVTEDQKVEQVDEQEAVQENKEEQNAANEEKPEPDPQSAQVQQEVQEQVQNTHAEEPQAEPLANQNQEENNQAEGQE